MVSIQTIFGNFNENQLKEIKGAIQEINESMVKMDHEKDSIKAIVDALYDSTKIPKKIIKRMARVQYKQNFQEEVAEHKEFETLFEGLTVVK